MSKTSIDHENLKIDAPHRVGTANEHLRVDDGVVVVVTQAWGPDKESLVGVSDVTFDGYPAVSLLVQADGREGLVHLSPFHGDRRKAGFLDIPVGTRCTLLCPVSRKPLDRVGPVGGGSPGDYYAIYLTPRLSEGEMVCISDIWGDYHSRIVDNFELISSWAAQETPET